MITLYVPSWLVIVAAVLWTVDTALKVIQFRRKVKR